MVLVTSVIFVRFKFLNQMFSMLAIEHIALEPILYHSCASTFFWVKL